MVEGRRPLIEEDWGGQLLWECYQTNRRVHACDESQKHNQAHVQSKFRTNFREISPYKSILQWVEQFQATSSIKTGASEGQHHNIQWNPLFGAQDSQCKESADSFTCLSLQFKMCCTNTCDFLHTKPDGRGNFQTKNKGIYCRSQFYLRGYLLYYMFRSLWPSSGVWNHKILLRKTNKMHFTFTLIMY
jgi:hypothetical protein